VIRDLDRSYTTVSELHGQEEWLWSSLEAVEVALASAHRERVVAQAQLAGNYCYNCF
jgi:hypothetical protein